MASSGTINNTFRTGYAIRIVWSVGSQSVANNTSSVTATVQLVSLGSSYTINSSVTKNGTLTINGTSYSFTFSAALSGNQTKSLYSRTVTVTHNADGTKTCAFSCSAGIAVTLGGTYYGNVTASGSGVFNTIARATQPTLSASTFALGSTITINTPRASSGFTHTLSYVFGSQSGQIASGVGTSASWAVPLSMAMAIPNGTTGYGTVVCQTYSGSTLIGTKYADFTATVPASVVPSISSVALSEAVSGLATQFQGYVQNKSKLAVSVAAGGIYYSTIKAYRTTILGVAYTAASFTSGLLTSSGAVTVSIQVTDSRGRTASTTRTITVLAYSPPTIAGLIGYRSNADGSENYEGTRARILAAFSISPVWNRNINTYRFEYKLQAASTWSLLQSGNSYSYNQAFTTGSVISTDSSFDVRLTITDFFGSVSKTVEIPTAFTLIDYNSSGHAVAFGKVSEMAEGMEVDLPTEFFKSVKFDQGGKILWQGGSHMNGGQTAYLSEQISSQMHGIVLVFSSYENNVVNNYSINSFFVHKSFVALHSGVGHMFIMGYSPKFEYLGAKYLYILDNQIKGYADNTAIGTSAGITYRNSDFVLRYVIGV